MGVLSNDPFYARSEDIHRMTYFEVWEWIIRKPWEEANKDRNTDGTDLEPEAQAQAVAKFTGEDAGKILENMSRADPVSNEERMASLAKMFGVDVSVVNDAVKFGTAEG